MTPTQRQRAFAIRELIRMGWSPAKPNSEQAQRIVDDIIHVKPYADGAYAQRHIVAHEGMSLTPAELRVLAFAAQGWREKQTAAALHLNIETVKSYSKQARRKLGARNTAHAVAIAYRAGLLELEEKRAA